MNYSRQLKCYSGMYCTNVPSYFDLIKIELLFSELERSLCYSLCSLQFLKLTENFKLMN